MDNEIEIGESELKKIKPNECGLVYDETRGVLIAVCNKNGEIRIMRRRWRNFEDGNCSWNEVHENRYHRS